MYVRSTVGIRRWAMMQASGAGSAGLKLEATTAKSRIGGLSQLGVGAAARLPFRLQPVRGYITGGWPTAVAGSSGTGSGRGVRSLAMCHTGHGRSGSPLPQVLRTRQAGVCVIDWAGPTDDHGSKVKARWWAVRKARPAKKRQRLSWPFRTTRGKDGVGKTLGRCGAVVS